MAQRAALLGLSIAEYARRVVLADLGEAESTADVSDLFDLGFSRESTDVARNKNAMLADAIFVERSSGR